MGTFLSRGSRGAKAEVPAWNTANIGSQALLFSPTSRSGQGLGLARSERKKGQERACRLARMALS